MNINERVAYIKGLVEGLDVDATSKEGKILNAVIELLSDMADEVTAIDEACAELGEQIDAVDEDLYALEDDFYGEEYDEDYDDEEIDGELYEVECPECHDIIYLDESMLEEEEMNCPTCGTRLEFEFECDCDGDCDCE